MNKPRVTKQQEATKHTRSRTAQPYATQTFPKYAIGDCVEWFEGTVHFRGAVVEIVASGARPQTPGLEITTIRAAESYVIEAGNVTTYSKVKSVGIVWPKCVRLWKVNEAEMGGR